jgi:DNA modification methylase
MQHTTVELNKIHCGDALNVLQTLPSESAYCIVTSPPYYALRNYGVEGQIGLEQTPDEYIKRLIVVFDECRRVLTKDGTMWLVMGDSYAGSGKSAGHDNTQNRINHACNVFTTTYTDKSIKSKDLLGIPWTLALALRNAGWYLRQDIIWHKPNPMPESVRDRCTKAHEYLFFLSKSPKYYFNHEAMLEPAKYDGRKKTTHNGSAKYLNNATGTGTQNITRGGRERWQKRRDEYLRNKRSVWTVPTRPFKGAHFATFPPDLIRTCIEAGCPSGDVVLDPFMGAGTTAIVAELGRNYVGIELNPAYIRLAEERIKNSGK